MSDTTSKISEASKHPILLAIVTAAIGTGATILTKEPPVPVTGAVNEAEKIYWTSIQPPNDSEENYCSYLEQYPKGNFVSIAEKRCPAAIEAKEQAAERAKEQAEKATAAKEAQASTGLD